MKNKKEIIRHGEVIMKSIGSLPQGAELKKELKEYIVAHSETGHHHVLTADKPFGVYEHDGQTYIMMYTTAELWHKKTGKDIHTPHKVKPAIYKVVLKKEFDYFKGILRQVRD